MVADAGMWHCLLLEMVRLYEVFTFEVHRRTNIEVKKREQKLDTKPKVEKSKRQEPCFHVIHHHLFIFVMMRIKHKIPSICVIILGYFCELS